MQTKIKCPRCGEADPSSFNKNRTRANGFQTYCKTCEKTVYRPTAKDCSGPDPVNLAGQKFHRLLPLEIVTKNPVVWRCRCDCGSLFEITAANLVSGNTKSCGCLRRELGLKKSVVASDAHRLRPFEPQYNHLKRGAKKRKTPLSVLLSFEEFVEFTKINDCHYCGRSVNWDSRSAYHLDRKDNQKPYTKENCVVCCTRCNWSKGSKFSYDEWLAVGEAIRQFARRSSLGASV
jgi:hypothetical protein